jgi:hypothetical protein
LTTGITALELVDQLPYDNMPLTKVVRTIITQKPPKLVDTPVAYSAVVYHSIPYHTTHLTLAYGFSVFVQFTDFVSQCLTKEVASKPFAHHAMLLIHSLSHHSISFDE